MTLPTNRRQWAVLTGAAGIALTVPEAQADTAPPRAGAANFVTGDVSVSDASGRKPLTSGSVVREGQTIETAANAEAHVVLDDGGFLAVRPSSRIQIDKVKMNGTFDDTLSMRLLSGAIRSITGWVGKLDRRSYQLTAATATIGIRGTDHQVAIVAEGEEHNGENAGIHNWVAEGGTTLKNSGGAVDIEPGHAAWAGHHGQAPQAHAGGIPAFLQARRTRHEARIEGHAKNIRQHIETRMRNRGMLKNGERMEDAIRRHQALAAKVGERAQAKEANNEEAKSEREKRRERLREGRAKRHPGA